MNTIHDTAEAPRVSRPPSANPDRREALKREEERLHELRVIGERALLVPYEQGEAVLRVRESKVHEIAEGGYGKAEDYVGARLKLSAKTLHRRVVMVEVYDQDEYLALLAAGVSLTTIERLAGADPEVREALQALAVEIQDDLAVTDALRAWTRAKKKEDDARSDEGLVKLLAQAAQQSILERLEAQAARRASREAQAERRQSGRESPTEELRERLEQERRELDQQRREQAVLALRLQEEQAALKVEVQRLEELRAEVELRGAGGAAVGGGAAAGAAEVQRLEQALTAALAQVAQARAEAQAARDQLALAQAQAAQAQADKLSSARGAVTPDNLSAARGAVTPDNLSAAALEQRAVLLWEQEQRLLRKEAELAERAAAVEKNEATLAGLHAELLKIHRGNQLDLQTLKAERQTLMDIRVDQAAREQELAALAVMSSSQAGRWPQIPYGLGGTLIYLADELSNVYTTAAFTLRESVEQRATRLNPGELALALELGYQLQRADSIVRDLGTKIVEDFRAIHPRLAAAEFEAYDGARAKLKEERKSPAGGAASIVPLPKNPALGEGFAVPIKALLGTSRGFVRERGLLGTTVDTGEGVLLALSRPQTLLVTGQPGSGKTHLLLVIIEMLIQAIKHISTLENPALVVWFHLGLSSNDYPADLGPATQPNRGPEAIAALHRLGADPVGLPGRRVIFVPPGQTVEALKQRQREYPGAEIRVIRLAHADRFPGYLRVLLGLEDNPAGYLRGLDQAAASLGDKASPEALLKFIHENKRLNQTTRASALDEVNRAAAWHLPEKAPQVSLWADLEGAHVIVDMRSDNLTPRDALGVVMTLLGSLSQRRGPDKDFLPAVAVLDEFNKIVAHSDLSTVALSQLTEVRHRKTWTFASGQLPDQFPEEISELSSGSICGQTEGAGSYEALCRMKPALRKISRETFAKLKKGEVVVCFRDANDERYRGEPLIIKIRPACAQPGGQTRYNGSEAEGED